MAALQSSACRLASQISVPASKGVRRRCMHATRASCYDPRPLLSFNHVEPPSPEAAAAIIAARRDVFGIVEGDGKRSGRKVLRRNLYGPAVRSYYPVTMPDLKLHKVGLFSPAAEDKFRAEEANKRLGKSRAGPKARGPLPSLVARAKLDDLDDSVMDQVDWFAPEDALPEEEALSEFLSEDMGMTPAEVAFFLPRLNEAILLEVEEGRVAAKAEEDSAKAADSKAARARDRSGFRKGADDKALKGASSSLDDEEEGGDAADGEGDEEEEDGGEVVDEAADKAALDADPEVPALRAQLDALRPALEAWRTKNGGILQAAYDRHEAMRKELELLASTLPSESVDETVDPEAPGSGSGSDLDIDLGPRDAPAARDRDA